MAQPERKLWFRTLCAKNGYPLKDLQLNQLDQFVSLILEWNKKINLISRKDEENIWTYHILHCVSPLFKVNLMEESKIVDIGSGGGLPGIPLKILRPDISLLCLDATRKKVIAVEQIIGELKLEKVEVVWGRAEEIGLQPANSFKYDFTIARAVCQLSELIALSVNFLKRRDRSSPNKKAIGESLFDPNPPALIAFKGGNMTHEIDLAKRRFPKVGIHSIDLAFSGSEHLIASDKKIFVVHL